jgi:hypothetical protein
MSFQLSREGAEQASTIASWLFIATAPLTLGAIVQWIRAAKVWDEPAGKGGMRLGAELLTFAAVMVFVVALVLLALVRRSQIFLN